MEKLCTTTATTEAVAFKIGDHHRGRGGGGKEGTGEGHHRDHEGHHWRHTATSGDHDHRGRGDTGHRGTFATYVCTLHARTVSVWCEAKTP
ncbi:MAG: hypothetical protein IJ551_09955 [Prevotella sp.]|nr:hypothetical protein [Prevotella sp.]